MKAISVMASCRPIVLNGRLRAGRNRLHATQFGQAWRAALVDYWSRVGGWGAAGSALQNGAAGIACLLAQFLFDTDELVILCRAIGARQRAGLDLPAIGRHCRS